MSFIDMCLFIKHYNSFRSYMMKKHIFTVILAVLLLSQTLVACSEAGSNDTQETKPTNQSAGNETTEEIDTENLTDYEKRQLIPDDLPDANFNGAEFRVLTSNNSGYSTIGSGLYEIVVDELNGDACNDSVYNRNIDIEERFNVKIAGEAVDSPETQVNTFVTAGTNDYHIVGFHNWLAKTPISNKSLYNWKLVNNVNLDKPWHNQLANNAATINNTLYAVCSDLAITSMTYTYAFFFNVDKIADYGYTPDSLYDIVKSGGWTIDKVIEMTNEMYEDTNGNGTRDVTDNYGFGYAIVNPADVWLAAFDQPLCQVTPDNQIEITFMTDKTVSIYEKLLDWHYNTDGFYKYPTQYDEEKYFLSGNLVMAPLRFYAAYNKLREMEDTYSILPYPKWDTEQENYYTNADDKFTAFGFPLTSYGEIEFVGTIFEALCAESYKQVYPVYYDTALKGKYSSDPHTAEMIDLIMAGRNFDFSFEWGETFQQLPYFIRRELDGQKTSIASDYKKVAKAMAKSIDKKILPLYGVE